VETEVAVVVEAAEMKAAEMEEENEVVAAVKVVEKAEEKVDSEVKVAAAAAKAPPPPRPSYPPVMRPLPACVGRSLSRNSEEWEELERAADAMVSTRVSRVWWNAWIKGVTLVIEERRVERERQAAVRLTVGRCTLTPY